MAVGLAHGSDFSNGWWLLLVDHRACFTEMGPRLSGHGDDELSYSEWHTGTSTILAERIPVTALGPSATLEIDRHGSDDARGSVVEWVSKK